MAEQLDALFSDEETKPQKREKKNRPQNRTMKAILADPVAKIKGLITRTEMAMDRRAVAWRRYRAKYRVGLNYLSGEMNKHPVVNYIYAIVESVKANVARSFPDISVEGVEGSDYVSADLVSKLLVNSLKQGGLHAAIKKVGHHGAITGLAWMKLRWDDQAADGQGDNVIECIPPEDVLVDPLAVPYYRVDGRTNARYIIHRRRDVSIDEIMATYDVDLDDLIDEDEGNFDREYVSEAGSSTSTREKPFGTSKNTLGQVFDVYECWFQTYEPLELDDEGNVIKSPWYIVTVAGNTVLDERYSIYAHGNAPFYPWFCGEDDGAADFYHIGIGEVEEIEPLQDKAAILDLQIDRNIRMTVNRQRVVNRMQGLSRDNVNNQEGWVYEVSGDPRMAMMWDNPPQLGQDVYTYRQSTELAMQNVSGVTDVMAGRKPTGLTAAKAITQLQSASQVRILEKQESLLLTIQRVVKDALRNVFQMYDTERTIRLLEGQTIKLLGRYPDELQPGYTPQVPMTDPVTGQPMIDPITGEPMMIELEPLEDGPELDELREQFRQENGITLVLEDLDINMDVRVGRASPLPEDKGELATLAMDLFRLGGLDRQALLETLEWPNAAEIVARLGAADTGPAAQQAPQQQGQQQMAMLEALMQGGGQGGMPPFMG